MTQGRQGATLSVVHLQETLVICDERFIIDAVAGDGSAKHLSTLRARAQKVFYRHTFRHPTRTLQTNSESARDYLTDQIKLENKKKPSEGFTRGDGPPTEPDGSV
ncbi:hypothetical protein BgiMline_025226 [Biomphalaria glabrata]